MQAALVKLDGIEADDIVIDYDAKTATVDCADATVKPEDLVKAFEGTKFSATAN